MRLVNYFKCLVRLSLNRCYLEQLDVRDNEDTDFRMRIDEYHRQIRHHMNEYRSAHVEFTLVDKQLVSFPSPTLQLFHLFEHTSTFDLSLIREPAKLCFDASKYSPPTFLPSSTSTSSPSSSIHRREKIFLPSVLVSASHHMFLFSNKAKQLHIFSIAGTLIDQFSWDHNDIVDMCHDQAATTTNDDAFFVLSTNGSVHTFIYHQEQHSYSWSNLIAVNNQTYYTQIMCDSKLSYLYLFMSSKHRLDQWTINKSKRTLVHCSNQVVITNDHVEHLCASNDRFGLLLRDKNKILSYRIEIRHFTDLLVTICVITLDRLSKPMRLLFDNRQGFILAHGNQLCAFGCDGELVSKRIFDDIHEIKRATFCHRSTVAILTENDQLFFYLFGK